MNELSKRYEKILEGKKIKNESVKKEVLKIAAHLKEMLRLHENERLSPVKHR